MLLTTHSASTQPTRTTPLCTPHCPRSSRSRATQQQKQSGSGIRRFNTHLSSTPTTPSVRTAARRTDRYAVEAAELEFTEQRPFLEPVLRCFFLGLGAGVLLEFLHVFCTLGFEATTTSLSSILPRVLQLDELHPLLLWDNFLAMSSFVTAYGLEVAAIYAVLKQFPDDKKKATRAIMSLPTLPKRMVPNLPQLRRSVYSLLNGGQGPVLASATATATATAPPSSKFVDGGQAVLDRGVAFPPLKGPSTESPPTASAPGVAPGAPLELEQPSVRRARELQERRGFLKNFWYAAAMSHQLSQDSPLEVEMLGRKVALFRDAEGRARCLDNVCPHRGAPLGAGWVKDVPSGEGAVHSCLTCPYHGWAFDTEGKLREVPSSPDQEHLPKRSLVPAYPVEEKGGFIWLFYGSSRIHPDERPPIPFVPELEDPNWQPVYGELEFDAPHWSVFDNAIDMAHIHYLHADSFGNESKPVIMDMQARQDTFSVNGTFQIHNKPVNALWEWTARDAVPVEFTAFLPSTSAIKIELGAGVKMITFVNTVPIDANRSINRFCLIRNFAGWDGFDVWAQNAMFKILGEDKQMVERLQPERMRAEISLSADLPQMAFRQLRSSWASFGYIEKDPESLQGFDGRLDA